MSSPLRKDQPELLDEELTTADLAQGRRPVLADRPKPVLAERPEVVAQRTGSEFVPQTSGEVTERLSSEPVQSVPMASSAAPVTRDAAPLFPSNELEELRNRWSGVQTAFVDEPRKAVEQADGLVASAMKRLAEVFAEERSKLEQQWDRGDDVSTEDLRIALQRYRSFFQRLLTI